MKSYNDPSKDATGICKNCGKAITPEESVIVNGKLYCRECAAQTSQEKRLYRSRKDRILFGVCGGIANYLSIDPTIVRVVWVILLFVPHLFFVMVVIYIVLGIITPLEPLT